MEPKILQTSSGSAPDDASNVDGDAKARVVRVSLAIAKPVPAEVPVGADVMLQVTVACAAGSDLRGGRVNILAQEQVVASRELIEYRDGCNETDEFAVPAPDRLGEFTWTLLFPRQQIAGVAYQESSLPVSFRTKPLRTSLAVWEVPSPVQIGDRFPIKVGAKSSGACALGGAKIDILDETGAKIGHGTLGDAPLAGTSALYWSEIGLAAPPRTGMFSWTATIAAEELKVPHAGASTTFSFVAVKPPEHRLTVKVIECASAAPLEDVQVGLGPYRAATDAAGLAQIETPAGNYRLAVWKSGFEAPPLSIEIAADTRVQVELKRLPEEVKVWD
jgi:hypothetical protein